MDEGTPGVLAPMKFDPGILADIHVAKPQVDIDAADLLSRYVFKGMSQVEVDLLILSITDLTTLGGGDTPGNVGRLCERALLPVPQGVLAKLGYPDLRLTAGGVCVYSQQVEEVKSRLNGRIPIAAVSTDFPHGQNSSLEMRCKQISDVVARGANEIDVVARRELIICHRWLEFYDELVAMRNACGKAHLKVILGVGDIMDYRTIAMASAVAIMAGADFIKTSTGMEGLNANFPMGLIMIRVIRDFFLNYSPKRMVGFKPAGGIRNAGDARKWVILMLEELGRIDRRWISPALFRLGASGLYDDIAMQLMTNADGGGENYADLERVPMG